MKRALLVTSLLAVGCGLPPTAQFEVQLLSVDGTFEGRALDAAEYTSVHGEDGGGGRGLFTLLGTNASVEINTCSLGDLATTDPYAGGDGGAGGRPLPDPMDCVDRLVRVCEGNACVELGDVALQIVEEDGWRRIAVDAAAFEWVELENAVPDRAHIELRYRDAR